VWEEEVLPGAFEVSRTALVLPAPVEAFVGSPDRGWSKRPELERHGRTAGFTSGVRVCEVSNTVMNRGAGVESPTLSSGRKPPAATGLVDDLAFEGMEKDSFILFSIATS
jgi:hypothetical protein